MRILIHSDEYYPTCAACAYRMKVFADTFMNLGNEVTIIASSTNRENESMSGCRERIVFAPTIKMKKKTTIMRMLNNLSFAMTSVACALFAGKADVVITTSPPPLVSISGWMIAKLKRAKLVYDVRDIWPDVALEMNSFAEDSFYCKLFRTITGFMYRHADIVTTVSPGKVEKIKGKVPPAEQDKVWLVGNGFDESILEHTIEEATVREYELDSRFSCVYIGNIGLAQGLDVLLDMAAKIMHREVQFLLFGNGAEREKLEKRAREMGLANVKICGTLAHDKVFTVLNHAKVSFIPLKNANMTDSIPTKVYEALGIGCPVLLVADGDSCDIVHETGLGRCVSPEDTQRLPEVFDAMVEHYEELLLQRGHARALMLEKYSRQQIAVEFEERLKNI